jgi:hypothetical protein
MNSQPNPPFVDFERKAVFVLQPSYLDLEPGPTQLVGADGQYQSGWYQAFRGAINLEDATRAAGRPQSWLHVSFDTPRYFVSCHLAALGIAGHTAVMLVDKEGETSDDRSCRGIWLRNHMKVDRAFRSFREEKSGSSIDISEHGIAFDVSTKGLRFKGRARPRFDAPFVQVTGYPQGKGTLQWWGNLELDQGRVERDGIRIDLEPGSPGCYDRTVGHRRKVQNWNWLSTVGDAWLEEEKRAVPFSLQMAKDQHRADPIVIARKYVMWLDGQMMKFDDMSFTYTISDIESRGTSPWQINAEGDDCRLSLIFSPAFKRRERGALPLLYKADFLQYFGTLSGIITRGGKTYDIKQVFALAEDSYLSMRI